MATNTTIKTNVNKDANMAVVSRLKDASVKSVPDWMFSAVNISSDYFISYEEFSLKAISFNDFLSTPDPNLDKYYQRLKDKLGSKAVLSLELSYEDEYLTEDEVDQDGYLVDDYTDDASISSGHAILVTRHFLCLHDDFFMLDAYLTSLLKHPRYTNEYNRIKQFVKQLQAYKTILNKHENDIYIYRKQIFDDALNQAYAHASMYDYDYGYAEEYPLEKDVEQCSTIYMSPYFFDTSLISTINDELEAAAALATIKDS